MKSSIGLGFAALLWLVPSTAYSGGNQGSTSTPIYIPGARAVDLRSTSGYLSRYTTIPSSSLFATTGGRGQVCSFVAVTAGVASDGQRYSAGQTVYSSRWLFEETTIVTGGETTPVNPNVSKGALRDAVRSFLVFCDSRDHLLRYLLVSPADSMLNPHFRLTALYNGLQLTQPTVFRNPVVDRWGGLITRYPAWLAIDPGAWRPHRSNSVSWRGWLMYLFVTPLALDFHVVFTPDPTEPSPAFDGIVPCVARGATPSADAHALPAFPTLPDTAVPGVNGPCTWTPPGPGSVRIEARITYSVTFWANGYTEQQPDYVWSSAPALFPTGELSSVNTNR